MNNNQKIKSTTNVTDNYNGWTGEKLIEQSGAAYIAGRDVKHIAKDIRSLIRNAVKAGLLPKMKTSVRIERYAGGRSIDIRVTEIDDCILNIDAWRTMQANYFNGSWVDVGGRYNQKGREILDLLKLFYKTFQRSKSHGQSDYHDTNFYGDANFCSSLERSQREKFLESAG